jgi:signal transduction histidine kinase
MQQSVGEDMQHANPHNGDFAETSASILRTFGSHSAPLTLARTAAEGGYGELAALQRPLFGYSVVEAIEKAADRTAAGIAAGTKQLPADVRQQLDSITRWLTRGQPTDDAPQARSRPPVVAREYIAAFRTSLLAELDSKQDLDSREVVRLLIKVDEAAEAWKRTDRGKFISRLTGSDCADAVVAIAHDIRSPLCSILLLVDSLRRAEKALENPVRDRQLGLIYGAALGLSTTVSNLIGAARGEELLHGQPIPFSVTETLQAVGAIVQPMCEEKGLPLDVHLPKDDARIGHPYAIHQALLNLTSNALRYTDIGSVSLGCNERAGNLVEFWVQDTGPGVPEKALERLFDGFPPEGAALRFSSAGLGLAIVRTLVEAMSSTLQVNTGSTGTRFSFRLHLPRAAWGS